MANIFTHVPYQETGYFSHLVTDYLSSNPSIKPFYKYEPNKDGLAQAIADRAKYPINRPVLVATLTRQYKNYPKYSSTEKNIQLLLDDNTFTVCTAHQPNLLTGYLYFIYKILHTIKLAETLAAQHPGKHFVPVYYMGSEDNDIEELGTFRFRGEKYVWDGDGQAGAVGRMNTAGLKPMLTDLFRLFGPNGKNCDDLQTFLTNAYLKHKTIGEATHYLVNELFGRYGLVIINPDEASLKSLFIPVMEDELLSQRSYPIVTKQIEALAPNYKAQAHPRLINLFYLADGLRERIEQTGDTWRVVDTNIQWSQEALVEELHQHPERFSPNVVLRGLFQETILPNVAFIGGGAEVAYWMQLKPLFEHYQVFLPAIHLRQSVLWIDKQHSVLLQKMGLSITDIFKTEHDLIHDYVATHTSAQWQTSNEAAQAEQLLTSLKLKATNVDATLASAADAALTKIKKQLDVLEKKMLRAEKRKMETELARITRLKAALFPNGSLQERVENFSEYYLQDGIAFFDTILNGIQPLRDEFLVIE